MVSTGKSYNIPPLKKKIFEQIAAKIITELDSRWDYRDFDAILLSGGGGQTLSEYILPHFPNMKLVDNPQHANVNGFQKIANKLFGN